MFSLLAALRSQTICFERIGYYEMKDIKQYLNIMEMF
jgi:hypothetical protein